MERPGEDQGIEKVLTEKFSGEQEVGMEKLRDGSERTERIREKIEKSRFRELGKK
jgi:hypothetical protein